MRNFLYISIIWLLSLAAFCSCSNAITLPDGEGKVLITGSVSDIDTKTAIEGAAIRFTAYEDSKDRSTVLLEQSVYTDSKGSYNIMAEGFSSSIRCRIEVSHKKYISETHDISITWSGISFDSSKNTFFVNDCDIHLKRVQ